MIINIIKKLLFALFFISNIYPQIDTLIAGLDDPSSFKKFQTLRKIKEDSLVSYIPALEERIFLQNTPRLIQEYLLTLAHLKASNIIQYAQEYMLLADNFLNYWPPRDQLDSKIQVLEIFFKNSDYSFSDLVFQLINRERAKNEVPIVILRLLGVYLLYNESYEEQAKTELLNIIENDLFNHSRAIALDYLFKKYGDILGPKYEEAFLSDNELFVRNRALEILFAINYSSLQLLLRNRLSQDPDWSFRIDLARALLIKYGEPIDLKAVIDYQPIEPEGTAKSLMGYAISKFIPPRPTVSTSEMIDNLIDYTRDLLDYGWITKQSVYQNYVKTLKAIQDAYRTETLSLLCENLDLLINNAEKQRKTPLITEEAYKFLYYHGNYIKENVETEFGVCP